MRVPGSPWDLLAQLASQAESEPLALLVDDVQWLDDASLVALGFAIRRLLADRVAVVLAARPEIEARRELAGVTRLQVPPLADDDAAALLRGGSPTTPPDAARAIARALGGVPLALVEAPSMLSADVMSGRAPIQVPIPVGESIRGRFARGFRRPPPRRPPRARGRGGRRRRRSHRARALVVPRRRGRCRHRRRGGGRPARAGARTRLPAPAGPIRGVRVGDAVRAAGGAPRAGRRARGARPRAEPAPARRARVDRRGRGAGRRAGGRGPRDGRGGERDDGRGAGSPRRRPDAGPRTRAGRVARWPRRCRRRTRPPAATPGRSSPTATTQSCGHVPPWCSASSRRRSGRSSTRSTSR